MVISITPGYFDALRLPLLHGRDFDESDGGQGHENIIVNESFAGEFFPEGGALGAPMTAFQYDWNMLPIGQQLWLEHLLSYEKFPPLQAPESYNLSGILDQVKKANASHAGD